MYHTNIYHKNDRIGILISDKVGYKAKSIDRANQSFFITV